MFATLIVRVTLISRFVLCREIREISVSLKLHVIKYVSCFFGEKKKRKLFFFAVYVLHLVRSLHSEFCT